MLCFFLPLKLYNSKTSFAYLPLCKFPALLPFTILLLEMFIAYPANYTKNNMSPMYTCRCLLSPLLPSHFLHGLVTIFFPLLGFFHSLSQLEEN